MTTSKHKRIVLNTLRKLHEQGFHLDEFERVAEAVVNRFETAVELELEEADEGVAESGRQYAATRPGPAILPVPDPAPSGAASSLILEPRDLAARAEELPPARQPESGTVLRLPFRPNQGSSKTPQRYWKQEDLRDYLATSTPEALTLDVPGRAKPVQLRRNLEVMYGVDLVKLTYNLDDVVPAAPSMPNSPAGESVSHIAIDTPVFATFSTYDQEQDVEGRMQGLLGQARTAYRPRPEHLDSVTPRRVGALTYDIRQDPHDETDVLPNPITGKFS